MMNDEREQNEVAGVSGNRSRRPGSLRSAVLIFLLFFSAYAYVHQNYRWGSPVSRLDLLHAIVRKGTVKIDSFQRNTSDKALFEGHYYCDKAPGTVALALPSFALAKWIVERVGIEMDSRTAWLATSWISTIFSVGLITALGAAFFYKWIAELLDERTALITTTGVFLGTLAFTNATTMMSHGMTIGLLSIALWALMPLMENSGFGMRRFTGFLTSDIRPPTSGDLRPPTHRRTDAPTPEARACIAGLCCGWVLASEFSAGLAVAGLFALTVRAGWRAVALFCLAAMPGLLLIGLYNWLCLGNPFQLPYSYQASFPAMQEGLYAIKWPDLDTAGNLLLSPMRGLFFWSPFLALGIIGFVFLYERNARLFWLTYLVTVLQIAIISGRVWDWQAGLTLGPRLLAPLIPFLAVAAAFAIQKFPKTGGVFVTASVLLSGLGTCIDGSPRYEFWNPLLELHWPKLMKGELTHNLGQLAGINGSASLLPVAAVSIVIFRLLWRRTGVRGATPANVFDSRSVEISCEPRE